MKRVVIIFWVMSLVRLSSAQQIFVKEWDKNFGGTKDDLLFFQQQTVDKGFILTGGSASGFDGTKTEDNWDTTYATQDAWVLKIDSNGLKEWDKRFGGLAEDGCNNVQQTKDGGYILAGMTVSGIGGDKTQPSWGGAIIGLLKLIQKEIRNGTDALVGLVMTYYMPWTKLLMADTY